MNLLGGQITQGDPIAGHFQPGIAFGNLAVDQVAAGVENVIQAAFSGAILCLNHADALLLQGNNGVFLPLP
ncbi:hypothetical protein SRABI106_02880 [Rahnella aquatilis]|nr:hypothetical protein SRABI106_02880 [Rahnella aquatilis]